MRKITVEAVDPISASDLAFLNRQVADHHGLKTVADWCMAQEPPLTDVDVVTQDEFTHDLIVTLRADLFLVYDST